MAWWILEVIQAVVLVSVVVALGPLIRRFGRAYAADVFDASPRTGKSYLVLMDIAYYLIFGAYVLFVLRWQPAAGWEDEVTRQQVQSSVRRLGGMLLILGLLHGVNVLTLPLIGRMLAGVRELDDGEPEREPA